MVPEFNKIHLMNCIAGLKAMKPKSVNTCVSSPPYYALRVYDGVEPSDFPEIEYSLFGQVITVPAQSVCLGLEATPKDFIGHLVYIYRLVYATLTDDGTAWINIGDSYASAGKKRTKEQACRASKLKGTMEGQIACKDQQAKVFPGTAIKVKDMLGIPWMLAFALREDGWYLRQDIIWHKTNCMPESCNDRCTKNHEYIFLLSKNKKYFYDNQAIMQPIAASTVRDPRVKNGEYSDNRPERGFIGNANGGKGMLKPKYMQPVAWAQGPGSHTSLEFANMNGQGRKARPSDNRGGNQGTGDIPAVSKRQTFKRDNHHHTEPIFGQSSVQHRPDRKDTEVTGFANKRSVWTIGTFGFKEAHFATFPPALIIDCIKAGASEYGCCAMCGMSYRRISTKELLPGKGAAKTFITDDRDISGGDQDQGSKRQKDGHRPGHYNNYETTGWKKTCKHLSGGVKASVVLDMFMGSGTTAIVAAKLNRAFIGFEQSPAYFKIAERRMRKELGLFNPMSA